MHRIWIGLGALAGVSAVAMAAVAAHGLPQMLDATSMEMVRAALQIHGWHALALVACGIWAAQRGGVLVHCAGAAFAAGLVMFCGSVYALAIGSPQLPSVAPIGGTTLMVGWVLLGFSALRGR